MKDEMADNKPINEPQSTISTRPQAPMPSSDSGAVTPRRVVDDAGERAFREPSRESTGGMIELEIGEISIRGYSARDRARIDTAFREELGRIITERFAAAPSRDLSITLDLLDTITIPPGMKPEAVGKYMARVVGGKVV